MQYGPLIQTTGSYAANFAAQAIAAQARAVASQNTSYIAEIGNKQGQVTVPGHPDLLYVTRLDPGCSSPAPLMVPNSGGLSNTFPAGTPIPLTPTPPGGGPRPPTPNPPRPFVPYNPNQDPTKPPITPPPPGSPPYYPPAGSPGLGKGSKLIDNCLILDTAPYGEVNITTDITNAILSCAQAPCGYKVTRATLKMAYDSYVGNELNLNLFDPGDLANGGQDGQGNADNFLKVKDAKGATYFCPITPVTTRSLAIIYQFLQGSGSITVELYSNPEAEDPGPIVVSAKAHDVPFPYGGNHGRVAIWLTAIEYELITHNGNMLKTPQKWDFAKYTNTTQGWNGTGAVWTTDWGNTLFFNSVGFNKPVYFSGGRVAVTWVAKWFSFFSSGPGMTFNCVGGGDAHAQLISSEGIAGPGDFTTFTRIYSLGEGAYMIGMNGSFVNCQSVTVG